MNNTKFLIFLSLFLLITLAAAQAETIESEAVIVVFDGPLREAAQEVIKVYPVLKKELETIFNWGLDFKTKVVLTTERENFRELSGSPLVVAYALPQQKLIVIDYTKMTSDPFIFRATLKHELSHLLLHDHIKSWNLPKWLDEGIAQWVSGGISEILMGGKGSELSQASLTGNLIPLRVLRQTFPKDEKRRLLAYAEAKSVLEYIESHFGLSGIRGILAYLKDGEDIDTAVLKTLSLSMEMLEESWQDDLGAKVSWIAYFGNNLVLILFSFGGLLTVFGFIRLIIQRKRYREKEEEEELLRKMFEL